MAIKVSLINMKGGVGKSTITVNLAWHFAYPGMFQEKTGKKVLVVDLDPQFNASQYLVGARRYKRIIDDDYPTVWDIFEQHTPTPSGKRNPIDLQKIIRNVYTSRTGGKIDLIPSRLELSFSLKQPAQKEYLLQKVLGKITNEYDLILIDCAPTESFLTTSAYLASDTILVPVKPEFLSTIGLPLLVNSIRGFRDQYETKPLELAGIVFNETSDYSPEEIQSKKEVKELAKKNGWFVFRSEIRYSRSYPRSAREGKPIFQTSYVRTKVWQSFRNFGIEFGNKIGL